MNTVKQHARLGLFHLKEAISLVLFNAEEEGPLLPNEIRKRLGIPRADEPADRSNTLIAGVLFHLETEGRAEYVSNGVRGWKITETEAALLQETSNDV